MGASFRKAQQYRPVTGGRATSNYRGPAGSVHSVATGPTTGMRMAVEAGDGGQAGGVQVLSW